MIKRAETEDHREKRNKKAVSGKGWIKAFLIIGLCTLLFAGCESGSGNGGEQSYKQISQEEAARIMEDEEGYILLDVRTSEEYAGGHIPGAINIPVETIGDQEIEELPEKDQLILVYCRSGRRSVQAASKLADKGYRNVMEFGGINSWTGDIEK